MDATSIIERVARNDPDLTEVSLSEKSGWTPSSLIDALKVNTVVLKLDLSYPPGPTITIQLTDGLRSNRILSKTSRRIDAQGAQALSAIVGGNHSLTTIELDANKIGDEGAIAFSKALRINCSLRILSLSHNKIGDAGAIAFGKALRINCSLRRLNLSHNKIGDEGVTALMGALQENDSLRLLSLEYNMITHQGAMAIGDRLKGKCGLTDLDLTENEIGDAGAIAIGSALKVNRTLRTLSLGFLSPVGGCTNISDSLDVMIDEIPQSRRTNHYTEKGFMPIIEALRVNSTLASIRLGGHSALSPREAECLSDVLTGQSTLLAISVGPEASLYGARLLLNVVEANHTLVAADHGNCYTYDKTRDSLPEKNEWMDEVKAVALKLTRALGRNQALHDQALEAAASGNWPLLSDLLAQGVSIYAQDKERNTLLHLAARHGSLSVVKKLLRRDFPLDLINKHDQTPLDLAHRHRQVEVVVLLEGRLDPFVGLADRAFQDLLAQYQQRGHDHFVRVLQQQTEALSALIVQKEEAFTSSLLVRQGQHTRDLVQRVLEEQRAYAAPLNPGQVQEVRQAIHQGVHDLTVSIEYERQSLQLQALFIDQINQRQSQLIDEALCAQEERKDIRDKQDPLYQAYVSKQIRAQEQLALQSPPSVCVFYNTIEQILGAKVSGAVLLTNGLLKRADTKTDKGIGLGADIAGGLCEGIPLVGGVVGSLVSFGIQELGGAFVDYRQGKKARNMQEGVIRLKDAMALSELCARRVAQSYVPYITSKCLTPSETKKAGKKAAKAMYRYLAEGKIRAQSHLTLEEKMKELVDAVHASARIKKIFKETTEPEPPAELPRSASVQVRENSQELQRLKEQHDLESAQMRNQIEQARRDISELRQRLN